MLYEEERKVKINNYIQEQSSVSVQQLAKMFSVSESTIRRDLKELEDAKYIKRTHGGAIKLEAVNYEMTYNEKEVKFSNEKENIAKKAVKFIKDGDTILLDSGTTTQFLAEELKRFSNLTVVTNSIMVTQKLLDFTSIEVIVVGGSLRQNTLSLVGHIANEAFKTLRVDKAFIATNGLDIKEGLTTPNIAEASTKKRMIEISKEIFVLADHTKVEKVSFVKFCSIGRIDNIVIDDRVDKSIVKALEEEGINVFVAKV